MSNSHWRRSVPFVGLRGSEQLAVEVHAVADEVPVGLVRGDCVVRHKVHGAAVPHRDTVLGLRRRVQEEHGRLVLQRDGFLNVVARQLHAVARVVLYRNVRPSHKRRRRPNQHNTHCSDCHYEHLDRWGGWHLRIAITFVMLDLRGGLITLAILQGSRKKEKNRTSPIFNWTLLLARIGP